MNTTATIRSQTYNAVWRWHFYAALFVVPFLILLPVTGVLMLLQQPIEAITQASLRQVPASGSSQPVEQQLDAVRRQFPGAQVCEYIPPAAVDGSSEFAIELPSHGAEVGNHGGHGAPAISVFVDPYTTRVLGTFDPSASLYAWAKSLHGSLALGPVGEILIEIAAGLAVLMVLTGAFLAWPRSRGELTQLIPRRPLKRRAGWRAVHGLLGLTLVVPLLFFLLSGLTWTSVWGGKLVQAWSALPGQNFEAPQADALHEDLNRAGPNRVPWVLEPTPLPASGSMSGHPPVSSLPVDLDAVVVLADKLGFERFRVHLPRGEDGVWTIAATTIAGDITNPGAERTVHIDRYSGRVLADLRFADYPLMGKAMSASIPLHQGDLGLWNWLLNVTLCIALVTLVCSGLILWWKRRPAQWSAPVVAARPWRAVGFFMLTVSLVFPLAAAAIAGVALLDLFILRRVRRTAAQAHQLSR